ncbi:protein REBELOTE [Daucus carota subsp. sativus]|uniref:Nucleolar complex protein 2 homolog n=1 Tax=Daucus carota subsp. sativus TaxID=79200 RepID=A0A166DSM7_DAUCS|nr:PREDICTED: nucleolar complex protein 2 homolog [Daucus carota subsp. sativus]
MGKLGKKARKFAKKNLQSVLRKQRKTKTFFKKRPSKGGKDKGENEVEKTAVVVTGSVDDRAIEVTSLDALFTDSDVEMDASDSDGYLSEDNSCLHVAESDTPHVFEGNNDIGTLSTNNRKMQEELIMQRKKLDRLKKKDPEFVEFLRSYKKKEVSRMEEMYSDEDEENDHISQLLDEDDSDKNKSKVLSTLLVSSWSERVKEDHNDSALSSLLNAYRDACHFGTELSGPADDDLCYRIQNSEAFCNVIIFMLQEADNIFRGLLKISPTTLKKETILELKNTSKWKKIKPFVKSYLRSTLFLLNQVTDSQILALSLTRLRASTIFFAAFPSLLQRLIKISVHLWATGSGDLSSCSFHIIKDVAAVFSSSFLDTCLTRTYKAYIARCKVVEIADIQHIEFLKNSFIELCSVDVQKSCAMAILSIKQLAKILQHGLKTKNEEAIKSICSWQYANCIDIWVSFITAYVEDYNLKSLLYTTIQLVNGVAYLFPGPRYFPLRVKCIKWLNSLSRSSGVFIPIASFLLDTLEHNTGKEGGKNVKAINLTSSLKLPKQWLKSHSFQVECVFLVIEMLSVHFAQWSYHISFPDLATIPLIRLRKFYELTNVESVKRSVKRLIDQVEQNVEFVQKKRDEVSYSPNDQQNADSFLQLEKGSLNSPFTQYYRSVMEKAASRNLHMFQEISFPKRKRSEKGQTGNDVSDDLIGESGGKVLSGSAGTINSKRKRQRVPKV